MNSRNYERAAEFCKLVGTPDLLEYLGLSADEHAEEARKKLKSRRKYMQGMQSNPKYKNEALYLIKHFSALDAVLADPNAYLHDAMKRAESVHLPVLEMTIKGVLAGGNLTADQEDYLRRNALELGVTEATFEEILDRLAQQAAVSRPTAAVPEHSYPPHPVEVGDYYKLLGVERTATLDEVRVAYQAKVAQAKTSGGADTEALVNRLDLAWNTLSQPSARNQYELSQTRTGPPARTREVRPDQAATAPPVRVRNKTPQGSDGPGRLEIMGDPVRYVRLGNKGAEEVITIRNGGNGPLTGRISSDEAWLVLDQHQIDSSAREQHITVRIAAAEFVGDAGTGVVTIFTDTGEKATIVFDVRRVTAAQRAATAIGVLLAAALVVAAVGFAFTQFMGSSRRIIIHVDPIATEIQLDGRSVGKGEHLIIQDLPSGEVTLLVKHPSFKVYSHEIDEADRTRGAIDVVLEIDKPLDFVPTPDLTRGTFPQEEASRIVGARATAFDRCMRDSAKLGQILTGNIRVHIDASGKPIGMEATGKNTELPEVHACLERQAAAISFHELMEGEYATVRYGYSVTP